MVEAIELRVVRLPLRRPFVTAHGTTTVRDVLVVRALGPDSEGWGECAADTEPAYWYETVASAWAVLRRVDPAQPAVDGVGNPMAKAALEMALLDLELREKGCSLASHLGAVRSTVEATATCGMEDDPAELIADGYRSLKLKVSHDVRPSLDYEGVALQVDANGTLDPVASRDYLDALDAAGLVAIEQPLDADDLLAHAELVRKMRTTICLDESITSVGVGRAALALRAAGAICIKPSRLGGVAAAVRLHDACAASSVPAKVGGMLETGIGRAAAIALAGLPAFTMPADLSAAGRYWDEDIVEQTAVLDDDGHLAIPTGPGLGVDVRLDLVEAATEEALLLRPS